MRADRLLSILMHLQVHRRITARQLAEKLEVSERTIHRDMEALAIAGVPVVAERGSRGGWSLPDGYQTKLTGLDPDEIQALFLTQPSALLADLGIKETADAAQLKLLAALTPTSRQNADYVRQRIHLDPAAWQPSGEDLSQLTSIQEAIFADRKLHLTYQQGESAAVERLVDPLGLVAKGNTWYLVAAVDGKARTYRVSRVREARPAELPSARPAGFDLAAHWAESASSFVASLPRYHATVRIGPSVLPSIRLVAGRFVRTVQIDPPGPDGWSRAILQFDSEGAACSYLLGFGADLAVEEPPELRARLIESARAILAFYGRLEAPAAEIKG